MWCGVRTSAWRTSAGLCLSLRNKTKNASRLSLGSSGLVKMAITSSSTVLLEDACWSARSVTHNENGAEGWSLMHYQQWKQLEYENNMHIRNTDLTRFHGRNPAISPHLREFGWQQRTQLGCLQERVYEDETARKCIQSRISIQSTTSPVLAVVFLPASCTAPNMRSNMVAIVESLSTSSLQ